MRTRIIEIVLLSLAAHNLSAQVASISGTDPMLYDSNGKLIGKALPSPDGPDSTAMVTMRSSPEDGVFFLKISPGPNPNPETPSLTKWQTWEHAAVYFDSPACSGQAYVNPKVRREFDFSNHEVPILPTRVAAINNPNNTLYLSTYKPQMVQYPSPSHGIHSYLDTTGTCTDFHGDFFSAFLVRVYNTEISLDSIWSPPFHIN